jgi:hypothetical protein
LKFFKESVESAIAAKATLIKDMETMAKHCSAASAADTDTCIVLLKGGKRYDQTIEENLVKQFAKNKVATLNGARYRFSFEDPENMTPTDDFDLRVYAIRKGGFYFSMDPTIPVTWGNVEKFVNQALAKNIDDYDGFGDITIVQAPAKGFKQRYTPPPPETEAEKAPPPLTDEEVEALRAKKEKERIEAELKRREEMDRKMKEGVFETDEGDEGDYGNEDEDETEEEDEEVLEL